jgi:predicted SprT family Zn-dependent metalloprotease
MTDTLASYDTKNITEREYGVFQLAYDFFNAELFGGSLPHVLVTFQRHAKAKGYFAANRFAGRGEKITAHELAMNPDIFMGRTDEEILSTLAHEQAHVWQQTHGRPPRKAYHDKQWAAKMKEIGLQPTTTGDSTGKETGQRVTHMIIPGGRYAVAYAKLAATGFRLNWQSLPFAEERKKKAASKTKYTCEGCGTNAWAKPDTALICGTCYEDEDENGDPVISQMQPEEVDTEQ